MNDSNTLMFKIGIADVKAELDKHKKEIDSWVNSNPIKLKVQFEDSALDQLAAKLKAMGATFGEDNAEIKKLKTELASLKKDLEAALNTDNVKEAGSVINSVATETKKLGETAKQSGQEQAEAIKNNTRLEENYLNLLFKIESQMRATWQASRGFAYNTGSGSNPLYEEFKQLASLRKDVRSMVGSEDKDSLSFLSARFQRIKSEYKDMRTEADSFNKAQEKINTVAEKNAAILEMLGSPKTKVSLISEQDTTKIREQIDLAGALQQQIKRLYEELGRAANNANRQMPTNWEELARKGLYDKGKPYVEQMDFLKQLRAYDGNMEKQKAVVEENIKKLQEQLNVYREAGINVQGYQNHLNALYETYVKLDSLKTVDLSAKLGLGHLRGYTGPATAADDVTWASLKRQAEIQEVAGEAAKRHQRKLEELTNAFAAYDAQVAKSQRVQEGDNKARQESVEILRRQAEELIKSRKQALQSQAGELTKLLTQGKDNLSAEQYESVKNALRGVREEMRQIESVMQRMGSYSLRDLFNIGRGGMNYTPLISNANSEIKRNKEEKEKNAQATAQLSAAEKQLANSIKGSSDSMRGQSQVLSDLKTMAMQYLSVWGVQSFLNNIIELGGQLEQQRLSIGAILQDTAQANHLFSQIKALAIKSPFGVQQLDAMTKQLSAYSFKYSELYDWTKRLADISAATGTSVDRLALALGHVRSEGALSGYTLRQFSMGNIPLLEKLSENLGKTKQEIRKMTRNKEIGYEDVLNVLKQLTDEGGMFFNAQEIMAEALNAKFKNLRDSFQIMYSEMAEGAPGDFLKGVAETMTDLSRNWKVLMPMITAGVAGFGLWKGATIAFNYEAARTGKLMTMNAIATSKYSVAQLRAMVGTTRWTIALRGLGRAFASLLKFIFSPVTLGFAAVEGLIYLWQKHNQEVEKAAELSEQYSLTASESQKNIEKQLKTNSPYQEGMSDSKLKTGIDSMVETLKSYKADAQDVLNTVFGTDAEGRVLSLADKYKILREELVKTNAVYKEMKKTADVFEFGINYSDGGWFDENVETDLTDYAEALKKYNNSFTEMVADHSVAVHNALEVAKKASPEFKKIADDLTNDADRIKWIYENRVENRDLYNVFNKAMGAESGSILPWNLGRDMEKAKKEANKELDSFIDGVEAKFKEFGYDFSEQGKNLSFVQVGNLLQQSKNWLEKHPEWQNVYNVIWDKLNKRWGIPIVPETEEIEEELPKWMQDLQEELDKTGIQLRADMSMEQIVDEMKKAYDKAQTTINKLGPIALTAKVNIEGMSDADIEKFNDPTSFQYNPELYSTLKSLKGASDSKNQVDAAAKKRGLNLEGMKKNGSHTAEKKNQENAKAVREQVRVIKEAADAFEYWRKKVGDQGAWEHVKSEFGDVLNKIGITAKNIEDVRYHLNNIPNSKEYKAIADKKVKTEIDKEIAKENDQSIRKDFEKTTEEWASAMSRDIDELTRKWEIFNSVVSDTGDRMLAARISGISPGATPADLKRMNVRSAAGVGIDFESVLGMSDEEIDRYVESLGVAEEKIKAIQNGLKDWKKAEQDVYKSDIQNYAKWLGSLVDLESIRMRNQEEYNRILEETDRLLSQGVITQEEAERRRNAAATSRDTKNWQATTMYTSLYNNSQAMAEGEFYAAYNREMANLFDQMKADIITMSDYADKVEKLNKIAAEFKMQGFLGIKGGAGAYLSGGYQGLIDYHWNKAREKRAQNDIEGAEKEEKTAESMMKAQRAADQLAKTFNDLSSGADLVANMFDALGMEGAATAFGDAAGVLGGIGQGAQSLSALGPWGMAAGGILGGITSIAQLNDKNHERRIQELKREVTKIDNTLNTIKSLRERELGYDRGTLRSQLASLYKAQERTISLFGNKISLTPAQSGMVEYYGRYSGGNGYSQEYNALVETRKKYMEMYDEENAKKKKSQEALEEYKVKIAELDEEIMYFVQDLAKDLWSIDIQGWASQISDALWTAFENGEDAVKAFGDTAKDIVSSVAKNMMTLSIIEPMFKQLQYALFGEWDSSLMRYKGNAIKYDSNGNIDMQASEQPVLETLGRYFGEGGELEKAADASETFYKWVEKITGMDLSSDESKSGASSSIKNITESTADLLSAYVNATRASVAKIELMDAEYYPMYLQLITSCNLALATLQTRAKEIADSNAAIERNTKTMADLMNGLKNKTWKLPIA